MTTERMLFEAICDGDAAAYDALADYYDEAGLAAAAAGVRKAKPFSRRPLWRASWAFAWVVLPVDSYMLECPVPEGVPFPKSRYRSDLFAASELVAEYRRDWRSAQHPDLARAWAYAARPGVLE